MTDNELTFRGFESGWLQRFFNEPFDPLCVMLAMRTKLLLDVIDELGHSYNLQRKLGLGWIDWGEIPGESPDNPDEYFDPLPYINPPGPGDPGYVGPSPGEPDYFPATPGPGDPGYVPGPGDPGYVLPSGESSQLPGMAGMQTKSAGVRDMAGGSSAPGSSSGGGGATPGSGAFGFSPGDLGPGSAGPVGNGGNAAGWDCCMDVADPASYVHIGAEETTMKCGESIGLTVDGEKASCGGENYGWMLYASQGSVDPINGLATTYTAPACGDDCIAEQTVYLVCNGLNVDSIIINIDSSPSPATIGYTSQQMQVGEEQTLTAIPEGETCGETTYTWAIAGGGGSLDISTGLSVVYTAPGTNPECASNPTITLSANGEVVDSLQLAINAFTSGLEATRIWSDPRCEQVAPTAWNCFVTRNSYTCGGVLMDDSPCEGGCQIMDGVDGCPKCYSEGQVVPCQGGYHSPNYLLSHSPMDKRYAYMITAGCCPAEVL